MHMYKPKFTLLLPIDMNGLSVGGGEERNDRHYRWAIHKEHMSHTCVPGRLDYTNKEVHMHIHGHNRACK